jgi:predicted nucleotidyltransferase
MQGFDYRSLIRVLAQNEVEFIVVGGMSAVLQGVPTTTRDLDVVYRREATNIQRILAALQSVDARFRIRPDLSPNVSHLESTGHKLLTTGLGDLDMLGSIGKQLTYEDLIEHTEETEVGGFRVRVLQLETLIQLKEDLGRDKDLAMLPTLRATLAEKRRLTK